MTTLAQLPLISTLTGAEFVPIDVPNGDGTYTTMKIEVAILSAALGVVSVAAALSNLPTTMPNTVGALWNNGGVICVVQP